MNQAITLDFPKVPLPEKTPYKLFIPGPVAVRDEVYQAMARGLVGHRSHDFAATFASVQPTLKALMGSGDPVFLVSSSAWGMMEGAVRNVCAKKVLNCMSGAFSDKWHDVCLANGMQAEALRFEWGEIIDPEAVRKALSKGGFDAITIVHNETSTGVENPMAEIMAVVNEFPEIISVIDTVSSFSAVPLYKDTWGVDVIVTGSQKALALPPGLAIASVSERALERAKSIKHRGYYFDFLDLFKLYEKSMTPTTPCISLIYGLDYQLKCISSEGLGNRFKRHELLNNKVRSWALSHGFQLFPQETYASKTLTCISNNRNLDIASINKELQRRFNMVINCGYGKLKGKTFRISNMGDETEASMDELLDSLTTLLHECLN